MTIISYPALIFRDKSDAEYGVVFPDLPGCVTMAADMSAAEALAAEVLAFYVEGIIEDSRELPTPMPLGWVPDWLADCMPSDFVSVMVPVEITGKPASGESKALEKIAAGLNEAASAIL